jgi:hypothetical protein
VQVALVVAAMVDHEGNPQLTQQLILAVVAVVVVKALALTVVQVL